MDRLLEEKIEDIKLEYRELVDIGRDAQRLSITTHTPYRHVYRELRDNAIKAKTAHIVAQEILGMGIWAQVKFEPTQETKLMFCFFEEDIQAIKSKWGIE